MFISAIEAEILGMVEFTPPPHPIYVTQRVQEISPSKIQSIFKPNSGHSIQAVFRQ